MSVISEETPPSDLNDNIGDDDEDDDNDDNDELVIEIVSFLGLFK